VNAIVGNQRACVVCGELISAAAMKCKECESFQDWRRYLPGGEVVLALILSIISVASAVGPATYRAWNYRSNSYMRILGPTADRLEILVAVGNDGDQPSVVRSVEMTFRDVPIEPVVMKIANPQDQVIAAGKSIVLHLTITDMALLPSARNAKNEVAQSDLKKGRIVLHATIEETSRTGGHYAQSDDHRVVDEAPAIYIDELYKRHAK
jgi:hypothetical protein